MKTVVIGLASLDALHHADRVSLAFGGVSKNVACALARLAQPVVFVSPGHGPEWEAALELHFAEHCVIWRRLPLTVPIPFFEAFLQANGDVRREKFHDNGAFAPLTPALLAASAEIWLEGAETLIASADLHVRSLNALQSLCRQQGIGFQLISSSVQKARRILTLRPDLLALNLAEVQALAPQMTGLELVELAAWASCRVDPQGACLITLGAAGALLVVPASGSAWHQPVPVLSPDSTVGAGDTFFAALSSQARAAADWPTALRYATMTTLNFLGWQAGELPPQQLIRL